ncbi:MAG: hypothetical protein IPJ88_00290 [Myxococcales bacterium]|nr:MAG: hypothetical protein IPJ88_00290 [Myxococcales bacterium]
MSSCQRALAGPAQAGQREVHDVRAQSGRERHPARAAASKPFEVAGVGASSADEVTRAASRV